MSQPLVIAAPDVIAEQQRWLAQLTDERRLSPKTADAYERDLRQFLGFLTGHLGGPPRIADLADLRPLDLRAAAPVHGRWGAGLPGSGRSCVISSERAWPMPPAPPPPVRRASPSRCPSP